jgi:uncharacterized repeat protein (TIGR03803 family)
MLYINKSNHIKLLLSVSLLVSLSSQPSFSAPPKFEILHLFGQTTTADGATNPSWLIQGRDGKLYGSTFDSLQSGTSGTLFKIDITQPQPTYSNFLTLTGNNFLHFNHFTQAKNGHFYGVGLGRGVFAGPEFFFKVNTSTRPPLYNELLSLPTYRSDAIGTSELLQGSADKFYATMARGGNVFDTGQGLTSGGMIVQIQPSLQDPAKQVKVLHKFNYVNGATPIGGLIRGKDGKFYGAACNSGKFVNGSVTPQSNGILYSFDVSKIVPVFKVLHRFNGTTSGGCPQGVMQTTDGKLYGTTQYGGIANQGVIFSFDMTKPRPFYRVLHNFKNSVAVNPRGKLFQSKDGTLYGSTLSGGKFGLGTLFQLNLANNKSVYTVIHTFDGERTGRYPQVILAKDGNLYGFTQSGGTFDGGLVFRVKLSTQK